MEDYNRVCELNRPLNQCVYEKCTRVTLFKHVAFVCQANLKIQHFFRQINNISFSILFSGI